MEIFNCHKAQIIGSINQRIVKIDQCCNHITDKIYQYSDERIQMFKCIVAEKKRELDEEEKVKLRNLACLKKLKKQAEFYKEQESQYEVKISQKCQLKQNIEKKILFLQEKNKEQQPHLKQYIEEKSKSHKNGTKVRYAKEKLNQLNTKYRKLCSQTQYKTRLIQLMQQKISKSKKQKQQTENNSKESKDTMDSCIDGDETQRLIMMAKNTQFSQYNDSIITSFRD